MYWFVREPCLRQSSFNDKLRKCSDLGQENEILFTTASSILSLTVCRTKLHPAHIDPQPTACLPTISHPDN